MAWTNIIASNLIIFIIMLCGLIPAQSIIYLEKNDSEGLVDVNQSVEIYPAVNYLHGFGITQYSRIDPERAFRDAREKAIKDLKSNLMTSVLLEVYSTHRLDPRIRSEFAINDEINEENIIPRDSIQVGQWAVYIVGYKLQDSPLPVTFDESRSSRNWKDDLFSPVNINGVWFSAGTAQWSRFNPERSFILAKQNALQNLSFHRQTVVQAQERLYNEDLSNINYHTSRSVLTNIHVVRREQEGSNAHVLIAVHDDDIINWRN